MIVLPLLLLAAYPAPPLPLAGGRSPDGRFEVAIEADIDSPKFEEYDLKGGDEEFPAFLVLEVATRRIVARLPWLADVRPGSGSPMRDRTEILWRADGTAVAINTGESHYFYSQVLLLDRREQRFRAVSFPDYLALAGRQPPPPEHMASAALQKAVRWLQNGDLVFEFRLFSQQRTDDPLWYRVTLRIEGRHLTVVDRAPLHE